MTLREIHWSEAEELAGKRLDRRRRYARKGDMLLEVTRWTQSCSGCFEAGEGGSLASYYPYDKKAQCHVGAGCRECGYTGKTRGASWVPSEHSKVVTI